MRTLTSQLRNAFDTLAFPGRLSIRSSIGSLSSLTVLVVLSTMVWVGAGEDMTRGRTIVGPQMLEFPVTMIVVESDQLSVNTIAGVFEDLWTKIFVHK